MTLKKSLLELRLAGKKAGVAITSALVVDDIRIEVEKNRKDTVAESIKQAVASKVRQLVDGAVNLPTLNYPGNENAFKAVEARNFQLPIEQIPWRL